MRLLYFLFWLAAMCPVRFVPPYRLMKLYERTGRHKEAASWL